MRIGMMFRKAVSGFCAIAALCWASAVWAGPEFDGLRADLQRYYTEQAKNPNKIIRYSDANGYLAKAIFDPQKISRVFSEASGEINRYTDMGALLRSYSGALESYQAAFNQIYGKYDAEYLDMIETTFVIAKHTINLVSTIKIPDATATIPKEQMAAFKQALVGMQGVMQGLSDQLISQLDNDIKAGKFRPDMVQAATARLEKLKAMQKNSSGLAPQQ